MTNPGYQHINDYQDVESRNIFAIKQAEGMSEAEILAILGAKSRDNSRTPMQWSAAANAGFTQGTPWLKPAANYPEINAEAALADQHSVFWHYRDLIALRKAHPIFTQGGLSGTADRAPADLGLCPLRQRSDPAGGEQLLRRAGGVCLACRAAKRARSAAARQLPG